MDTSKGISVVICCYNSSRVLPAAIQHLALQEVPPNIPWEIVIVDNASTDDTVALVAAEWAKYTVSGVGFEIVYQPKPGLNYAREMGLKTARFEYIIFCDDDNWLCNTYISTAFNLMEDNPAIGVMGGRGFAVSDTAIPAWFEKVQSHYAVGRQAEFSGDITNRRFVWGAGMVLRKNVLTTVFESGIKSYLSDRKGGSLNSGGDSEISMWFLLWGYRLWYNENLVYKHFIPADRLTPEYYTRLKEGLESSVLVTEYYNYILQYKNIKHKFKSSLKNAFYTFLQIIYYRVRINDKGYQKLLRNLFLLHCYNFIPSGSLLATMAKEVLPKSGYPYPSNKF